MFGDIFLVLFGPEWASSSSFSFPSSLAEAANPRGPFEDCSPWLSWGSTMFRNPCISRISYANAYWILLIQQELKLKLFSRSANYPKCIARVTGWRFQRVNRCKNCSSSGGQKRHGSRTALNQHEQPWLWALVGNFRPSQISWSCRFIFPTKLGRKIFYPL